MYSPLHQLCHHHASQGASAREPAQLGEKEFNDGKHSAGYVVSASNVNDAFQSARPSIVVGERDTSKAFNVAAEAQAAFRKISCLHVRWRNDFDKHFNSKYLPRIFPWAAIKKNGWIPKLGHSISFGSQVYQR